MKTSDWTDSPMPTCTDRADPLSEFVPGDTPGHRVDMDAPHELFHEQTKYHRATSTGIFQTITAHLEHPDLIAQGVFGRHVPSGRAVSLPAANPINLSLSDALGQRRSHRREDVTRPMSLEALSTLLHHAVRTNRKARVEKAPGLIQHFSPYPSAGALYPCEVYLILGAVEPLPPGPYRYDPIEHTLTPCRSASTTKEAYTSVEASYGQSQTPPACALVVTSVFQRVTGKYGARGYRLAVIEAGHILQNLSLVATALNLSSCVSASFFESELERMIGVDGVSEAVLASFLCGAATGPDH